MQKKKKILDYKSYQIKYFNGSLSPTKIYDVP